MLTLRFAKGERVHVGEGTIHVRDVHGDRVELVFDYPATTVVERGDLHDRRVIAGEAGKPLRKRVPAKEAHKTAKYEAAAQSYCHYYEDGAYIGFAPSKLAGRMTSAEAEQKSWEWRKSGEKLGKKRGTLINGSPSPTGND